MTPPLYRICAAAPAVTALLGADPSRIYPWGEANDPPVYPYVTFVTDGRPGNYLAQRPDNEAHQLHVDVWAATPQSAADVVAALRAALELHCYVQAVRQMVRDPETKSCRVRLELLWGLTWLLADRS